MHVKIVNKNQSIKHQILLTQKQIRLRPIKIYLKTKTSELTSLC